MRLGSVWIDQTVCNYSNQAKCVMVSIKFYMAPLEIVKTEVILYFYMIFNAIERPLYSKDCVSGCVGVVENVPFCLLWCWFKPCNFTQSSLDDVLFFNMPSIQCS
jgi:hypothetical protein